MSEHSDTFPAIISEVCTVAGADAAVVSAVLARRSDAVLLERTASLFAAMGDPTRLRLLEALAIRELCVCDLAEIAGVSQSAVSHQLRALRELELVAFRREANRAVYRLADEHVRVLLGQGFEHAAEKGAR